MAYPARYCYVLWESTRVLMAKELIKLESIMEGVDDSGNHVAFDLNAVYNEGATLNINPVITSPSSGVFNVQFTAINSGPMLIFARGRWWSFISGETPSITLPGTTSVIYLNWWVQEVTATSPTPTGMLSDTSLVDSSSAQDPTADMGQLFLQLTTTNSLPTGLGTVLEQNTTPIPVFSFIPSSSTVVLAPTNSNTGVNTNVNTQALAAPSQAGLVYLTSPAVLTTPLGTGGGVTIPPVNASYPGVSCSGADLRLSDPRYPITHGVIDASVAPANLGSWTTPDNTTGGINSDKIIYTAGLPSGSSPSTVETMLVNHFNEQLGNLNTHPTLVSSDSATFEVKHTTVDTNTGDSFLVQGVGTPGTRLAAITHQGDVYSSLAAAVTPVISRSGPYTSTSSGSLASTAITPSTLSIISSLLSAHINQNTSSNPHNVTFSLLGMILNKSVYHVHAGEAAGSDPGGYLQIPIGSDVFMLEWGISSFPTNGGDADTITFAEPFNTTCITVLGTAAQPQSTPESYFCFETGGPLNGPNFNPISKYGFAGSVGSGPGDSTSVTYWIAFGY